MLPRFLLYGCAGWVLEVLFTGTGAALRKDRSATSHTYLWMHPIYGATALALEEVAARVKHLPRPVRALAYTAVIYAAEYSTGWVLKRLLGRCPWDYTGQGWSVHGLVRLDYAPAWYLTALAFEPVRDALLHVTGEALQQTPEYREAVEEGRVPEHLPTDTPEEAGEVGRTFLEAREAPALLH